MARKCVLFEGILLILCGIGCMGGCYFATNIVIQTFNTACVGATATSDCVEGVNTASQVQYTPEQCMIDIKVQGGCTCQETLASCNCSDSIIMGQLEPYWPLGCYIAGAVGAVVCIFLTGIPAVIAAYKWCPLPICCNVNSFSFFSAVFWLPFLVVGGVMCFIAALARGAGPVGEFLSDCETNFIDGVNQATSQSTGSAEADAYVADAAAAVGQCGAKAFCSGVKALSSDMFVTAIGVGVPFFVAGLLMFSGQYACCCCKKGLPGYSGKVIAMNDPSDIDD